MVDFVEVFDSNAPHTGSTIPQMWSEKTNKGAPENTETPPKFEIELDAAPFDYIMDIVLTTQSSKYTDWNFYEHDLTQLR